MLCHRLFLTSYGFVGRVLQLAEDCRKIETETIATGIESIAIAIGDRGMFFVNRVTLSIASFMIYFS